MRQDEIFLGCPTTTYNVGFYKASPHQSSRLVSLNKLSMTQLSVCQVITSNTACILTDMILHSIVVCIIY
jgi:hypothetical protein